MVDMGMAEVKKKKNHRVEEGNEAQNSLTEN